MSLMFFVYGMTSEFPRKSVENLFPNILAYFSGFCDATRGTRYEFMGNDPKKLGSMPTNYTSEALANPVPPG